MKALVTKYGGENSSILDFTFLLTCFLVFTGLLCVEELLDVNLKHLKIQESHLEILISKSKADQHREGYVYISTIKSECCPIKYFEVYLQCVFICILLDISNGTESPLICRIFKTKSGQREDKENLIIQNQGNF